jgi:uncharacterized protein (TIGR03437 family)
MTSLQRRIRKLEAHVAVTELLGLEGVRYTGFRDPRSEEIGMHGRLLLALAAISVASGQTISTFIGTGVAGYSGDGGPSTQAEINDPVGLATDAAGNIYVADQNNNRIRKVAKNGVITTFAGTGVSGPNGDGGPAVQAQLDGPTGVCVAPSGAIYVNDLNNNKVREISTSGIITTVAGDGSSVSSGDGGPATAAGMVLPIRCAVDASGNLYIADQGGFRIRKVDVSGTITTYAGTGVQGFSGDGGPATQAELNNPTWVTADGSGNLYVADQYNQRIRVINSSGTITTIAGNGNNAYGGDGAAATSASLSYPGGIVVDSAGSIYIADSGNARIRKVSGGIITTVAGNGTAGYAGDGGPALQAEFNNPFSLTSDTSGDLYVGDLFNNRVRESTSLTATSGSPIVTESQTAGSFGAFSTVAPGSWIEIYGSNLSAGTLNWATGNFNGIDAPTTLGGTTVTIGGQSAFIDYVSAGQVNAQVPSGVPTGPQPLVLTTAAGNSAAYSVTVNATEPGMLAPPSFEIGGIQYVVALSGANYILPPGAISGLATQRATPGETVTLYGVGFGAVTPNIPAGQIVELNNTLANSFGVSIGGVAANVTFAGLVQDSVGLYQFNVVVPNVPASDTTPLTFTLGGASGKQTLNISIGN